MKHLDLIGMDLKNDGLCDLFETYDVQVVYEYDRTHENLPDQYHAEIPDLGLQFVFDERQIFATLFMRQVEVNTFKPFDEDDERIKRFNSKAEALQYARDKGNRITEGKADFMGEERDWVRFEYDSFSIHYEYVDSKLRMITIHAGDAQQSPGCDVLKATPLE